MKLEFIFFTIMILIYMKISFDFLLNNIDKIMNKKKLYFNENDIKKLLVIIIY